MRTRLALDDELVAKAQALTGLKEKSSLVREALKALIERESARRSARLGGERARPRGGAEAQADFTMILVPVATARGSAHSGRRTAIRAKAGPDRGN